MTSPAAIEFLKRVDDSHVTVRGELTFSTALAALRSVASLLQPGRAMRFDLSGVTRADSAAVALLIEWLRMARKAGCELRYSRIPEPLQAIISVGGVEDMLPVEAPSGQTETINERTIDG